MTRRALPAILGVALLSFALTACGASAKDELEEQCLAQAAEKAGVALDDLVIDEYLESPSGSADWRGTYPGGEWGCAAGIQERELYSVVTYPTE